MIRIATLIAAAVTLTAAPAVAGNYSAKPINPSNGRIIARDISWSCGADACQGSTEESRPAVLCQGLAKRAGKLSSFVANGRAFDVAELAKCNASAKGGTAGATTVANAN